MQLRPLRDATFRRLAAAYSINQFGNWFGQLALAVLVYDRTRSALATAAMFLALRFVPAFVGPVFTARVDTLPARRVLPLLLFGEAAIYAGIAALAHHFSLPGLLVLVAADGTLAIATSALIRSATAATLGDDGLLRAGNALLNIGLTVGAVAGPPLAGLLSSAVGTVSALLVDAASFVVAGVLLAQARELRAEAVTRSSALARVREGLRQVRGREELRQLFGAYSLAVVFLAAVTPIEVIFATRTLHAGDAGYGALLGAWGGGAVVGALAYAVASRVRLPLVLALSAVVMAGGYAGLAASPDLLVACAFSALGGIGNGTGWEASMTSLQLAAPEGGQSAIAALMASVNQLMPAIGFAVGGVVTAVSSPRVAYAVAAAGVTVILVGAATRQRASSRSPDPRGERHPSV